MAGRPEVIAALRRQPELILLALAAYFLLHVAARLALPASLELDEGQQLFLAQWLAVGYDTQPPFYNWLQWGVVELLGPSVFSLTVLKNGMLLASYILYGLLAALVLRSRDLVVVATLGLLTIPQISFEAQRDLTHTVAVIFAACLFLCCLMRTLKAPSLAGYALTGAAIGIGTIAKYNFVLLPAAALAAVLVDPLLRRRVFDLRIVVTGLVAALIVLPHGLWFLDNLDIATGRTIGKLTAAAVHETRIGQIATGLGSLALALIGFAALTLVLFAVMFGKDLATALRAQSQWTRFFERMMGGLVLALVCLVLFAGASHIKDRWLAPFFLVLPLYLCLKLEAAGAETERPLRRSLWIAGIIALIVPAVLFLRVPLARLTGDYEKVNVPYGPAITAILATSATPPGFVLVEDLQLAGNIRLHADVPVMVPGYERFGRPAAASNRPVLVIWREDGKAHPPMQQELTDWLTAHPDLPPAGETKDIGLPYHYGRDGDLYHFAYTWLMPSP
ncbi:glycosyltransferase family 39 protein [Rhizobium sp. TRM95111]|uniref:glycosyltransferase family 39 protein n=1 Tax=Rhizobium alarense TaxID=2846851 RepID=UPI001F4680B8|nr:glycosyltransferase family 39 protein [Rhizobium alarense]MCF3642723.1 glycosyltransferase family 39 protein [Rhizobium alarense]